MHVKYSQKFYGEIFCDMNYLIICACLFARLIELGAVANGDNDDDKASLNNLLEDIDKEIGKVNYVTFYQGYYIFKFLIIFIFYVYIYVSFFQPLILESITC